MAAARAFSDTEHEQTAQPSRGRYMRQRCYAAGCPYHAVLITNPETGDGLCDFHSSADDPDTWPKLSELLRRPEFARMNHELTVLEGIRHLGYKKCEGQIARVQKAGLACGMEHDELKQRQVEVWKCGQKCIETEVPAAFCYRVSIAFIRHAVNLAQPQQRRQGADFRERGMQHIQTALKLISGEILPAHVRPAEAV